MEKYSSSHMEHVLNKHTLYDIYDLKITIQSDGCRQKCTWAYATRFVVISKEHGNFE